jgi:hypothetical protein
VEPDAGQGFGQVTVTVVDLEQTGLVEPQGLAIDPTSGHLHIASPSQQKLYELTQSGQEIAYRDLSEFDLSNPQGMVIAASGDLTDDPSELSLYLADSGLSGGQIVELSFTQPLQLISIAADIEATLVRTTATSLFASPSPDPAGVAYLNPSNTLLISDSEVNEMPIFQGANLFETTLAGTLIMTSTTTGWTPTSSGEPTGAAYKSAPNPANARLFISDDNAKKIFELTRGADGKFGTADDGVSTINTSEFGSNDPEGIAYDSWQNVLYIADGVNNEVYKVDPGINGVFDGVSPTGDDQVTSFDTEVLGVEDPEGIAFNFDNGNLYIVGKPEENLAEITTTGVLVRNIGISAALAIKPAGLAYAPSTASAGVMNIYIVDRGIDNGPDPDENDGKLYEMTFFTGPIANDDSPSTPEDTVITIDVAFNDVDPDGNLNLASTNTTCPTCTVPTNGGLTNNGNGTFNYTPNPNYNGSDSFVYEICDTGSLCDTATVNITVVPVADDPPVANNDAVGTAENTSVTFNVAVNDSDPDGDLNPASTNTTCPTCSGPTNGTLVNNGNGSFTYTPSLNFNSADSFVYQICDSGALCDTATVFITINPPVANDDNVSTPEDTPKNINVAGNDSAPNGNLDPTSTNATCPTCSQPTNGSLTNNNNGTFSYNPTANFFGPDGFVYEICDTDGKCANAAVSITVNPVADPPVANTDSKTTPEDTPTTINVAGNDSDPDGNLNLASANTSCPGCSGPVNGSLAGNGNGTFSYTPNPNFFGPDSFVYQICDTSALCDTATVNITVSPVNDDPPVANTDGKSTPEDTPTTINVAANDTDPDGNLSPASANTTCLGCSVPANGSLTNNGNGTFTYSPGLNFNGLNSFVYEICDTGTLCATATVSITVNPVADPPVANTDNKTTPEDTPTTINVTANDTDPEGNLVATSANTTCPSCSVPANGSLTNNGNGTFTYTPNPNFSGSNSFVYEICDTGTLNGTFTYTPDPNFNGPNSFVYEICDSSAQCDTASVNITVNPVPDPPLAKNDDDSTAAILPVTIDVADNDTDPDNNLDPASANTDCPSCSEPASGGLTNNGNGTFTYTPNLGFDGQDSFVYEICDTSSRCDTASVTITVNSLVIYLPVIVR